jgi:exosortase D (VPLPA-CTERM-specific)
MVVVVSAIPITVIMNSVRIAMVGLLSERFGKSMAEGFLHDFEGWVVFMVCTGILFAEMAILVRIGPDKSSLRDAFYFAPAEGAAAPGHGHAAPGAFAVPTTFVVAGALVAIALALSLTLPARESVVPVRAAFAEFPMEIGDWRGRPDRLEADTLNVLKLHDYLLADYVGSDPRGRVNLHVAYYASQIDGAWMHSPQGCIPADGWEIIDLQRHRMNSVTFAGDPMVVNRVSIRKGNVRQIVYYWFQERGRITTDEHFSEKLYVLLDAVRRNRTDGAMVRLVTNAIPGESDESADRRLEQFAALFVPQLTPHIPG